MGITYKSWKSYKDDVNKYNTLSEENKKIFWEYAETNKLTPNITPKAAAERDKYVNAGTYNPRYVEPNLKNLLYYGTESESDAKKIEGAALSKMREQMKSFQAQEAKKKQPQQVGPSDIKTIQEKAVKGLAPVGQAMVKQRQEQQDLLKRVQTDAGVKASASYKAPMDTTQLEVKFQEKKQADKDKRKEDEKQLKATIQTKIDALDVEISKLKKEQGLFGTKNISKIAQLDKEKQKLSLSKSPVVSQFYEGATFGLGSKLAENVDPEVSEAIRSTEGRPGAGVGRVAGSLFTQAGLYGTAGKLAQATKFGQMLTGGANASLARQFAGSQLANLAVDTIIQTPIEVIDTINNDETLDQFAKKWATNRAIDVVFNGVIEGAVEATKALRTLNSPAVKETLREANIAPETVAKAIVDNDTETIKQIRDTIYVNPQGGASRELSKAEMPLDVPTGQMALPAPKNELDAFTEWRRRNFGGASGKVSEADEIALKQLYKEETGIDLLKPQRETPRTITPGELAEQRLLDLQERVRSGQIPQDEAEIVAKKLIDEMQAPKPQKTIAEQGVIEPNQNVLPQGGTVPRVETKTPETPIVGESESGLFRSTMAKNIDSPIRQKLEQAASDFVLPTTSNEARRNMARSIMADDFESALTHVKSGDKLTNSVEPFLADEVIGELNRLGRYDDIADVIASQAKKARASGQEVQAFSQWAKTSPEGIQRWAIRSLEEANIPKEEIKETATQLYKEVKEIREMTVEELAEQIRKQSKLYKNTSTEDLMGIVNLDNVKQLLTAKSMQKALAKIPTATASKLSTWQAMSHLLNLRTFSRNILGNMASMSGEKIAKIPAKAFDKLLALKTGQDSISLSYPKFMDEFKEGIGAAKQSSLEISLGVNRVNKDKYDLFMGDVFKSKPLRAGEKLLRYSLDTPDAFFKGMARADAIHTAVKARLGKEADKMTLSQLIEKATLAEIEEAKKYSEFVTFQNESWLANFLGSTKKLFNKIGFGPEEARFGVGDLTLKYTRVPGNIITRGIEYSPVGYFKSLDKLLSAKNLSAADQRKLAMELGRATTGTSLMALGMALRNAGVITGEPISDDYDAQAFERAQGKGEYKVNLSAIKRAIAGQDPTPQEGDRMESYNWIEPFSVPFAIGAKIADKYNRLSDEEKLDINLGAELQDLSKLVTQESFDLPSLYVVQQMAREYAYGSDAMEVASIPFKEAIPGIVTPSIVRQLAQTIDPTVRETRAEFAGGDDVANKVIANIPFLSKTLPPKLDSLGREQQRTGGVLGTMVNPAASSTLRPVPYGDKLDSILSVTGKASVYPERKAPTSFTFKPKGAKVSQKIELTPEETQIYQREYGQEYDDRIARLLKNKNTDQLSDKRAMLLVDQILDIKSDAKSAAQNAILKLRKRSK